MEYLPVVTPDEEEILNAPLFARRVRDVMAKSLEIPTVEQKLEDGKLALKMAQMGIRESGRGQNFDGVTDAQPTGWDSLHVVIDEDEDDDEGKSNGYGRGRHEGSANKDGKINYSFIDFAGNLNLVS